MSAAEVRTVTAREEISALVPPGARCPEPDAVLLGPGGSRAGLWWRGAPQLNGLPAGTVGMFSAPDRSAALALLARARAELAARGCRAAIGPMDRDTWRRHRLVTDPGSEPPFLLEPWTPPEWAGWWADAGFNILAEYVSSLNTDPARRDLRLPRAAARLAAAGVTLRQFEPERAARELDAIFEISAAAFRENFLYAPVSRGEFRALYEPLLPRIDPRLVLLAERGGGPCGFLFAYSGAGPGAEPAVVLKTLAVLPGRKFAGLGSLLVDELHQRALNLGFGRVIHALMRVSNNSLNISSRHAAPMRRYALMAAAL